MPVTAKITSQSKRELSWQQECVEESSSWYQNHENPGDPAERRTTFRTVRKHPWFVVLAKESFPSGSAC